MQADTKKYLAAGGLIAVWGAFAFLGKTPVDGFIAALGSALTGLGVWHAATAGKQPPQS